MNGAEIRALREKIGLKRPELCEHAGPPLTVAKLAGIETGRDPRYDELQALQQAFNRFEIGRKYLLGEKEEVRESPKLEDTSQPSDPTRWTSDNPSTAVRLDAAAENAATRRRRINGRDVVEPKPDPKWAKWKEWGGFEAGETVRVKAPTFDVLNAENWLKGEFTFLQRVLNKDTGESWVDVRAAKPKGGAVHIRSFTEDRIVKLSLKRRK